MTELDAMREACEWRALALVGGKFQIADEPLLPALGTPERDRLDKQQETCAGLLRGYQTHTGRK